MKFLLIASLTISSAFAQTVISKRSVNLKVDLRTTKIRLSNAGYGEIAVLKVLVPALADVTLADHRNEGEEAPCLATYDTRKVEDVVQGKPEILSVPFKITLTKHVYADQDVCKVALMELVEGKIRGMNFIHEREIPLPDRNLADCR